MRLHFHGADDFTMTTTVAGTPTPNGFDDYLPDVGGSSAGGADRFLVVWQRDDQLDRSMSSVYGRFATESLVDPEFVIASGGADVERPSVSQYARASEDYMVVHQFKPSDPAPWRCEGRLVWPSGVSRSVWESSRNGAVAGDDSVGFPQVAGSGERFLVSSTVFASSDLEPSGFGMEVVIERVDWNEFGSVFRTRAVESALGPFGGNRVRVGALAYDYFSRSHWAMTSDQNHEHGGNGYGTVQRFGFEGGEVESATIQTAGSSSVQAKSGGVTFDDDGGQFTFGWAVEDSSASRSWVWINRLEYPDLTPQSALGVSCSPANIEWSGYRQLGSEFGGVRIVGAPPSQPATVFLSLQATQLDLDPIGMTGCDLLVSTVPGTYITSLNTTTDGLGAAKVGIPISSRLPPLILQAQWFHFAPSANSLGIQSTRRLVAPIGL